LEEVNREDEAVAAAAVDEDAFKAGEGAELNGDFISGFEIRPGLETSTGLGDADDGIDFRLINGNGDSSDGDDTIDTRSSDEAQGVFGVEAWKEVAWKEGRLDTLDTVGIWTGLNPGGEEDWKAFVFEGKGDARFAARADLNGVPGEHWHILSSARGIATRVHRALRNPIMVKVEYLVA